MRITKPRLRGPKEIEINKINNNIYSLKLKFLSAIKASELTEEDMVGQFGKAWNQFLTGKIRMRKLVRIANSMGYRIVLEKSPL